jgi:hypothetical protein
MKIIYSILLLVSTTFLSFNVYSQEAEIEEVSVVSQPVQAPQSATAAVQVGPSKDELNAQIGDLLGKWQTLRFTENNLWKINRQKEQQEWKGKRNAEQDAWRARRKAEKVAWQQKRKAEAHKWTSGRQAKRNQRRIRRNAKKTQWNNKRKSMQNNWKKTKNKAQKFLNQNKLQESLNKINMLEQILTNLDNRIKNMQPATAVPAGEAAQAPAS